MGMICIEQATGVVREWTRNGIPPSYDPAVHELIEQDVPPPEATLWTGVEWAPLPVEKPQREIDAEAALAAIDAVLNDRTPMPDSIKAAFVAIRQVLA
jgi:hypothetical protein